MKFPFSITIKTYIKKLRKIPGWNFSKHQLNMIVIEEPDWIKNYLPLELQGKTVLDVGAGEGETAYFYLKHGAKQVIAVEPHILFRRNLMLNSRKHNIIPILSKFQISLLEKLSYDFLKMDIEGYEEILLGYKLQKPAVLEIHGLQLRDKFKAEGWRIKPRSGCTCYGFWKC